MPGRLLEPMPSVTLATLVKLVLASLVVGAVMGFLDVQPLDFYRWAARWIGDLLADFRQHAARAVTWLLSGAVVVVPVWLLFLLWRALGRKGRS